MILSVLGECFQIQVHRHIFTQETPHGSNIIDCASTLIMPFWDMANFQKLPLQLKR
jgi:hypothetical protein